MTTRSRPHSDAPGATPTTSLRPARPEEIPLLEAWRRQPASPFDEWAPSGPHTPRDEGLPRLDGIDQLVVVDGDDRPGGLVPD